MFKCFLNTYEAYKSMQSFGGVIADLDPKEVPSIDKAEKNSKKFASMVIDKIKENSLNHKQVEERSLEHG